MDKTTAHNISSWVLGLSFLTAMSIFMSDYWISHFFYFLTASGFAAVALCINNMTREKIGGEDDE